MKGADFSGRRHHRLNLLEVVHVERRDAVGMFGSVVEQLAHRNERHGLFFLGYEWVGVASGPQATRQILSMLVPPGWPMGSPTVIA